MPRRKPDPAAERPRASPACPFCRSTDAEVISLFGSQAITLQYRCRSCGSYFEAIRYAAESGAADRPA